MKAGAPAAGVRRLTGNAGAKPEQEGTSKNLNFPNPASIKTKICGSVFTETRGFQGAQK
jgi:hypothetical protein